MTDVLPELRLTIYPPQGGYEPPMKNKQLKSIKKSFNKEVSDRMSYVCGHLDGVKKMFDDGKYCIEIIQQNEAVIKAIKKVNQMILKNHLDTCVTQAIKGKKENEKRRKIKELLEVFKNI